jgi:hypothetical protein
VQETFECAGAFGCRGVVELEEAFPIEDYDRENGAELYYKGKCLYKWCAFYTQNILGDNHVPGR